MKNCIMIQKCRFDQQRIPRAILKHMKRRRHGLKWARRITPVAPRYSKPLLHKDACEMNAADPNSQRCRSSLDTLALPCRPGRFEDGLGDACVIVQCLHDSRTLDHAVPCK